MEVERKWQMPVPIQLPPQLIDTAGDPVVAEILYRRGYTTAEQIADFLQPVTYKPCDFAGHPLLSPLVERIEQALAGKEKITVYGDYDVDGITSTAVWVETLLQLGAEVTYHVPDRFGEGYGINVNVLQRLAATGTKLIITCDCGIANYQEIEVAKDLNIDILVTDHHELPEKLPDVPIFNPKMLAPDHPAYMLPGVGVSYIVARELLRRSGQEIHAANLLEMLALGIIADVVPLRKDNRWYLKQGLPRLLASSRPGIKALLATARIHPVYGTEEDIAFQVIPRLNAAGRLASARLAVDLLLAKDLPTAQKQANELNNLNETRKLLCDQMLQEALRHIGERMDDLPAIALYQKNWPEGVIGIVAGRLAEQYQKPALLMTSKENGLITGSARAGGNVNIFQALLACQDLLLKYGGHAGAAGFSLLAENLPLFIEKIAATVGEMRLSAASEQAVAIDAILSPDHVSMDLYDHIRTLAPFGQDNPPPVFLIDGQLVSNQLMKTGSAHRRLRFTKNGQTADAVWWNSSQAAAVDDQQFLARLRLNLFRDSVNVQLAILDTVAVQKADPVCLLQVDQFIDMRGQTREEVHSLYPAALFFAEGQDYADAVSRAELTANDTLVMLTVPPHTEIWTEILAKTAPQRVIVAWDTETNTEKQILEHAWRQLRGVVKFALRAYDGTLTIERVAVHLGWTRGIVTAGLMALADMEMICLTALDDERISISLCHNNRSNWRNPRSFHRFVKMLAEAEAYRNYMRNLPLKNFLALLSKNLPIVELRTR